jgi:hypothetical protein
LTVGCASDRRRRGDQAEGYAFHGDAAGFQRDRERYDALVAERWLVLRLTWARAGRS